MRSHRGGVGLVHCVLHQACQVNLVQRLGASDGRSTGSTLW
jgi:hypothetical protein